MKLPLIFSDFDNTLARSDKSVSAFTKDVIRTFCELGGHFVIVTGRSREGIISKVESVGLLGDFPVVSYQGGLIEMSQSKQVFRQIYLKREIACKVIEFARIHNLSVQTYHLGEIVIEKMTDSVSTYCRHNGVMYSYSDDLLAFAKEHDTYKVLIHAPTGKISNMQKLAKEYLSSCIRERVAVGSKELQANNKFTDYCQVQKASVNSLPSNLICQVLQTAPTYLEFFPLESGKGTAVKFLAEYFGEDIRDCIAFGDQQNDLDMLSCVGQGVAVANATSELKAIADEICESNDCDGVAKYIYQKVLLGGVGNL